MRKKNVLKLTPAEAERFEQFVHKNGGQIKASAFFGIAPATISRNINRHTGPSPLLRNKLVENGIVKS